MPIKCHTAFGTKIVSQVPVFLRCPCIGLYFTKNFLLAHEKNKHCENNLTRCVFDKTYNGT